MSIKLMQSKRITRILPLNMVYLWLKKHPVFIIFGLLIAGNFLMFIDFILGNKCLLFVDLGMDSAHQMLPFAYFFTNVYRIGHFWIHESGLGNHIFAFPMMYNLFDPMLHIVCFNANLNSIASRIVYYAIAKSVMSGLFFYLFLVRLRMITVVAIIGALCYAFCGTFTATSTWMVVWVPSLLASLAVVLWAYKVWQQEKRWWTLAGAIAYFTISSQAIVTVYQVTIFFMFYLGYDVLMTSSHHSINRAELFLKTFTKVGIISIVGVCLTAIVLLPHFYYAFFENYRYVSHFRSLFGLPHIKELLAIFLRIFSNDLAGTANTWSQQYGFSNYMELPFLYIGIVMIIAIPTWYLIQIYRKCYSREFFAMSLFLSPFMLALIFPGVRAYLFFGGKPIWYIRWVNAFVTAALVIIGSESLNFLLAPTRIKKIYFPVIQFVSMGWLALLGISYITLKAGDFSIIDRNVFLMTCGFIILYTIVLHIRNVNLRTTCLVFTIFVELTIQGHHTLTYDRSPLIKSQTASGGLFSNVYSNQAMRKALQFIKEQEQSFFRVSKTPEYRDVWDNSSLCQAYYGVRSYTSFNLKAVIEFFLHREIPIPDGNYLPGFQERHVLDNLVGVKYYLKRGELLIPSWAEHLMNIDGIEIFMNPYALPFGVVYHNYLWQHEFETMNLPEEAKDNLFMLAAVIPEDQSIQETLHQHRLSPLAKPLLKAENDIFVRETIKEKQANSMEMLSFENDRITGKVRSDKAGILFFSIPFDSGWHIYIDGRETEKFRVNVGFLGGIVPSGQHTIRLVYSPRYYQLGKGISLLTLGGWIVAAILGKKKILSFNSKTNCSRCKN